MLGIPMNYWVLGGMLLIGGILAYLGRNHIDSDPNTLDGGTSSFFGDFDGDGDGGGGDD